MKSNGQAPTLATAFPLTLKTRCQISLTGPDVSSAIFSSPFCRRQGGCNGSLDLLRGCDKWQKNATETSFLIPQPCSLPLVCKSRKRRTTSFYPYAESTASPYFLSSPGVKARGALRSTVARGLMRGACNKGWLAVDPSGTMASGVYKGKYLHTTFLNHHFIGQKFNTYYNNFNYYTPYTSCSTTALLSLTL